MRDTVQKKRRNRTLNINKSGSFSLEISLVFPIFMTILFFFIWQMSFIRCEMLFKSIIVKEAEKLSFIGALNEYSPELHAKLTGEKPDAGLSDIIMNEIYTLALKKQIKDHYELLCAKNRSFISLITEHAEFLECAAYDDTIKLTSIYNIHTPFRTITRQFSIPVRLWENGDHSGKLDQNENDSIWHYDNFNRGKILRRRFGGNLPFGFPVLSGYRDGNAFIIKSMDLTAPTWDSVSEVDDKIQESIDEIATYEGMPVAWGAEQIIIDPEDITSRSVMIVIPENTSMDKYSAVFDKIRNSGRQNRVDVEIIPYQKA